MVKVRAGETINDSDLNNIVMALENVKIATHNDVEFWDEVKRRFPAIDKPSNISKPSKTPYNTFKQNIREPLLLGLHEERLFDVNLFWILCL